MNEVRISDVTMKQVGKGLSLSFKEKLELSKLTDAVEFPLNHIDKTMDAYLMEK